MKNYLLSRVLKNRKLFHFILRRAHLAQKPFAKNRPMIRHLPHFLEKEHGYRSLPTIARTPFRDQWRLLHHRVSRPKYTVALFAGCAVDFIYPEQAKALMKILERYDVQVDFPMDQTCCGLPALMAAEDETAREVALQNIKAIRTDNLNYILTLCASCGSHLKHNYPRLLTRNPDLVESTKDFTDKIIDFSSFMINVLKVSPRDYATTGKRVAYHAPCHLCRGLKVTEEPRKLMEIAGLEYVRSKDEDVCCGFGGSYSVDFPEIASEILKKKLDNLEETDARLLVTDCPGCVMQLRGGMDRRDGKIKVRHLAEVIADQLFGKSAR